MKMKEIGPGVGASLAPSWIYQCHINKLNNTPFQKFITVVLYLCSIEFSFNYTKFATLAIGFFVLNLILSDLAILCKLGL